MDIVEDIVFQRVYGDNYAKIRDDVKVFNVFFAIDGQKSIKTIARENGYELEYLSPIIHHLEKLGLLIPRDGAASTDDVHGEADDIPVTLPKEYQTGIKAVDQQHQRLVNMVNDLDDVRKAPYHNLGQKQAAVGEVVTALVEYTISHFAFEESLMTDAQYKYLSAHKRIHELLIQRAGEYTERWSAGEDVADELYEVLTRWLFNHIRNDDCAFAPAVKARMKLSDRSDGGWISQLLTKIFK
jgi:hemerythrin